MDSYYYHEERQRRTTASGVGLVHLDYHPANTNKKGSGGGGGERMR